MKIIDKEAFCIELGSLIKEARLKKKLRQKDLANMVGISQAYLSFVEDGKRVMDIFQTMTICGILKINLTKLIRKHM